MGTDDTVCRIWARRRNELEARLHRLKAKIEGMHRELARQCLDEGERRRLERSIEEASSDAGMARAELKDLYKVLARIRRREPARRAEEAERRRRWRDPAYVAQLVEARAREIALALAAEQRGVE